MSHGGVIFRWRKDFSWAAQISQTSFLGGLSLSNYDEDAIILEGHEDEDEETAAIQFIAGAEGDERVMSPLLLAAAAAAVVALPFFIFQK